MPARLKIPLVRPLRPVGDRLLLELTAETEHMHGGILLPEIARNQPREARVIALGSGWKTKPGRVEPFAVKVGDRVLLADHRAAEITLDGRRHRFVREDEILGLLR